MTREVLLVEHNLKAAGLVVQALRQTIPDLSLEYANRATQTLDFVFGVGRYEYRHPQQVPDLILLSLDFPNRDGQEVFRILKSYIRTRTIPVVLLTERPE